MKNQLIILTIGAAILATSSAFAGTGNDDIDLNTPKSTTKTRVQLQGNYTLVLRTGSFSIQPRVEYVLVPTPDGTRVDARYVPFSLGVLPDPGSVATNVNDLD